MGRHFFTGGVMPSWDLFSHFPRHLEIEQQWEVNGLHYWRTCEEWLKNLDRNRVSVLSRFRQDMSDREAKMALQRWRIFFMACAELFRYRGGTEWFVAHYMLRRAAAQSSIEHSRYSQQPV
jgi:cyclopropane-fatty-acyl-phospholipid synthase